MTAESLRSNIPKRRVLSVDAVQHGQQRDRPLDAVVIPRRTHAECGTVHGPPLGAIAVGIDGHGTGRVRISGNIY